MHIDLSSASPALKELMEREGFSFLNTLLSTLEPDFTGELTIEENTITVIDKNGIVRFVAGKIGEKE